MRYSPLGRTGAKVLERWVAEHLTSNVDQCTRMLAWFERFMPPGAAVRRS